MKKLTILLVLLLVAAMLCACGAAPVQDAEETEETGETRETMPPPPTQNQSEKVGYPYDYTDVSFFEIENCLDYAPKCKLIGVKNNAPLTFRTGDDFVVAQGACSDGAYGYFALCDTSAMIDGKFMEAAKIMKIDMTTWETVAVSEPLRTCHSNGMTYNSKTNKLLVVHNKPEFQNISIVNPDTLVVEKVVTINSTVNFTANKLLTMQDDGNARKILRGDTTGTMLQVAAGANVTLKSSASYELLVIDGNSDGGKKGSGMLNTSGTLTLQNVAVQNNTWDGNNRGLGIYANAGSTVYINYTRIENIHNTYKAVVNGETKTTKAPAMIVNGATVHMNCATIKNCTTLGSGAVEITGGGKLYANSSTFTSNQAAYGGAIYVANNANNSLTVDGCLFESNHATGNGGAIQVDFNNVEVCAVTIKNSTFRNNSADGEGGAIGAATGGHLNISDTIFEGNTAAKVNSGEAATKVWGNDIRLGGATNVVTLSGRVKVCVFHNQVAKLVISGNLTEGSDVRLDGRPIKYTAASYDVIEFANEDVMNASKGYISLGGNLTDANKYLVFQGKKAMLQNIPVVTTQAELEQALANVANIPVIKIAANTTVSLENVAFPTTPVTIQGQTGSVLKYAGSTKDEVMMSFPEGSNATFQGVTLDGNAVGKLLIPAGANVTLANSTVTNMKGVKDRSLHVQGNLNIRGTVTIDGANWGLGVNGSGVVTSETGSKLVIKNATYGVTTHDTANVHIVEIETTNVSNSALYNDGSSVMVVDKANLGATASGKHTVDVLKGTVTLSNATITNAGGNAVNQRAGSLTLSKVTITNPGGYGVIQTAGSLTMDKGSIDSSTKNAVYVKGGSATISNTTITNTTAVSVLIENGQATLNTVEVTGTGANFYGIQLNNANAKLYGSGITVKNTGNTALQVNQGFVDISNFVSSELKGSHSIKTMGTSVVTINGFTLGVSGSNNISINGDSTVTLKGVCTINGTKKYNGIELNTANGTLNISGEFTTTNVVEYGIRSKGSAVNISGKVNTTIIFTDVAGNCLNVTGALTDGSAVTVDWAEGKAPAAGATAIKFASADVLTASKGFITLGATQAATQELSFGETTATLVAKQ